MSKVYRQYIFLILSMLVLTAGTVHAGDMRKAPANIQASLFIKLLPFNKNISNGGNITIYVLNTQSVAKAMKSAIGRKLGKSTLAKVVAISNIPKEKPNKLSVLYVSDNKQLKAATEFCRKYKILSITGNPSLIKKGVTLLVCVQNKKPKIMLNLSSTKKEGIDWHPNILKVAVKVK